MDTLTLDQERIRRWELVEIERSASEAEKKSFDDLVIRDAVIERYLTPERNTPFPLEYAYSLLGDVKGCSVLDYGCGSGENSVLIASHGGKPIGIDISHDLVDLAEQRMKLHGHGDYKFLVASAHDIPVPDQSIDVVFGMAILHHLDLRLASKEVFRVLKKGGRAIFLEPVRNSKLVWFIRDLIPYRSANVSPFERPLTDNELEEFALPFSGYESRAFSLPFVNLIETLVPSSRLLHLAYRLDGKILNAMPALRFYGSIRVMEFRRN